ncbi:MAG TPA: phage tail protein [Acidimicrobiales bacterium]|jgi:phage tail-like protein|nr:phage tail protein [Acidimicrobiales bacterium]
MPETATSENLLLTARFSLEVDSVHMGFFRECSGLGTESEVVEHLVVNDKGHQIIQKVPGRAKWTDITLKKSMDGAKDLWNWRKEVLDGKYDSFRRNGSIVIYNSENTEVARWNFIHGWPSSWKGSDLSSSSDEVATEELTIAHEGLERA